MLHSERIYAENFDIVNQRISPRFFVSFVRCIFMRAISSLIEWACQSAFALRFGSANVRLYRDTVANIDTYYPRLTVSLKYRFSNCCWKVIQNSHFCWYVSSSLILYCQVGTMIDETRFFNHQTIRLNQTVLYWGLKFTLSLIGETQFFCILVNLI